MSPALYRSSVQAVLVAGLLAGGIPLTQANDSLVFEKDIRPILKVHCLDCHGAGLEAKGGLDLRLRRWMVQGGDSGPAIAPGDPAGSFLMQRLRAGEMPPGDKKVSAEEIATLTAWIAGGAPTAREEPEQLEPGIRITAEDRQFWAFQPIVRPGLPSFANQEHVRTPVDAFIVQRMRDHDLRLSEDADRRTLIRRVYFDLTGLPPTWDQIEAFRGDPSPRAYEALVDRLLASPHYGERWGRHWLDVAGYADSEGYTSADQQRPWAHKYRDYVIAALNADKPYDQFVREQLAGDEMVSPPYQDLSPDEIEKLVATGFLRMAADGTGSGANTKEARNQTLADTIKILSTALVGLTVHCAQCHDHRYDPIPQTDYYRLRAVLEPAINWQDWRTPAQRLVSLYTEQDRKRAADIEKQIAVVASEKAEQQQQAIRQALTKELERHPAELRDSLREAYDTPVDKRQPEQKALLRKYPSVNITAGNLYQYNQAAADELKKYDARINEIRSRKPPEAFVRALFEQPGNIPETRLFHRGDCEQPRQVISPGGLTIAAGPGRRWEIPEDDSALPTSGRRLAYARWLTSGAHPLLARVIVNRVWMYHFGRAIAGTPGDLGRLGDRPSHPALLDWLADEFMASGWSLKKLHKTIMMSTVYRQRSTADPAMAAIDPENRLYWRKPLMRLDAEGIRDRILSMSGELCDRMYGPPVPVKADDTGQIVVDTKPARRSIYLEARRTQPVSVLQAFDAPVMQTNCTCRPSTTVATQSLMLMNSQFVLRQAASVAERIAAKTGLKPAGGSVSSEDWTRCIQHAWRLAYGRDPEPPEQRRAVELLVRQAAQFHAPAGETENSQSPLQPLTNICHVLLCSNEFLYVD